MHYRGAAIGPSLMLLIRGRIESGQAWRELLLLVVIPRVVIESVEIGYV